MKKWIIQLVVTLIIQALQSLLEQLGKNGSALTASVDDAFSVLEQTGDWNGYIEELSKKEKMA